MFGICFSFFLKMMLLVFMINELAAQTSLDQSKPSGVKKILVSAEDFGAFGHDELDDTKAIQKAVDSGKTILFPPGNYLISAEIVVRSNTKIIGSGVSRHIYNTPTQKWDPRRHTYFTYIGKPDAKAAAFRVSDYPVGAEPVGTQRSTQNVRLESFGIDCNQACGIGVYFVRVSGTFRQIHVKGSLEHAYVFLNVGAVTFEDLEAYRNQGNGFTIGRNVYGWKNLFADESVFVRPVAFFNGEAGKFKEKSNEAEGYGIGVFCSRGLTFIGYESSHNDGPGIWFENSGAGPVTFLGGYSEWNTKSAIQEKRATEEWGLWYKASRDGLNQRVFRVSDVAFRDAIRLTGQYPNPGRVSSYPSFEGLGYLRQVKADWPYYYLKNCHANLTGEFPHASLGHYGLSEAFGVMGAGHFEFTKDKLKTSQTSGIVQKIIRSSEQTGQYMIAFKEGIELEPRKYSITLTTGAGQTVGIVKKEEGQVVIEHAGLENSNETGLINYQIVRYAN